MKYGIAFGGLSSLCISYAWQFPRASIPLVWIALSFGVVSLSYFGLLRNAFFKRSDGRIPLWSKLLNLPFLCYAAVVWHVYRVLISEPAVDQITEDLVIGRRLLSGEVNDSYDVYVDLTAEFDEPKGIRELESYVCFPILDASVPSIDSFLEFLGQVEGKRIFVHCAQGHGRTGMVAVALLLRNGRIDTVKAGVEFLQEF